jgi:hypothetical protein
VAVNKSQDKEIYREETVGLDPPGMSDTVKDSVKKNPNNPNSGGKTDKVVNSMRDPFNEATYTEGTEGEDAVKNVRDQQANAENPTTASADPGDKLPEAVMSKDPNGQSQILMSMFKSLLSVGMIMALAGGAGGGNTSRPATSITPTGKTMINAFAGALKILSNRYSAEQVLAAFEKGFGEYGLFDITYEYQDIVKSALSNLIEAIIFHGENKVPLPIYRSLQYAKIIPDPLVTFAPDGYIQQYFTEEEDPYPGYIMWVGPNNEVTHTKRAPTEIPFDNPESEVQYLAELHMADALDPYIKAGSVTPAFVESLLTYHNTTIDNNAMDRVVGKNSSQNLMQNLSLLLGLLGVLVQLAQSMHLPNSVLNAGKAGMALTAFSRNMAMIKQMKGASSGAFTGASAMAGLGGLLSIVGTLTGSNISIPSGGNLQSLFSGGTIPATLTTAVSAAVTVAGVVTAMKYSGSKAATVSAAANIVRNFRI